MRTNQESTDPKRKKNSKLWYFVEDITESKNGENDLKLEDKKSFSTTCDKNIIKT